MKYYKIINGELIIRDSKNIIVCKNGKQIINPSPIIIQDDGWVEYIENQDTNEDLMQSAINELIDNILQYDKSYDVECFYIDDIPLWLDRDERTILQRRFELEMKNNIMTSTLWKNDNRFEINPSIGLQMLDELEMYAIKCFDTTNTHLNNVKQLKSEDDVKSYDYKVGYPDKLKFKIV